MQTFGSQISATLQEEGLTIHSKPNPKEIVLFGKSDNAYMLYAKNDRSSGFVVMVAGFGYEFVREVNKDYC